MVEKLLRNSVLAEGRVHLPSLSSCSRVAPQPPTLPLSSTQTTSRWSRGQVHHGGVPRASPSAGRPPSHRCPGRPDARPPRRRRSPSSRPRRSSTSRAPSRTSTSMPPALPTASMSAGGGPLGNRTTVGASSTSTASRSSSRSRAPSRGAASRRPGHDLEDRHVPHAVVAGAVVAGDAGAVEHEGDPALVQRDVHQHLVEGAVEEGRVDRDDRVQAAHREPGGGGDGVLLGDADVEGALGVRLGEPIEADRVEHRRGDRDDVLACGAEVRPSPRRRSRSRSGPWACSTPVSTSNGPSAWNWSASWRSAGS